MNLRNTNSKKKLHMRGFTLIELLISISIFVFMTALVVAKYSNFNQGTLLTNLGYDIAITLRTAQTYGLSVRADDTLGQFNSLYGVDFRMVTDTDHSTADATHYALFSSNQPTFTEFNSTQSTDYTITTYVIKQGSKVSSLCAGTDTSCNPVQKLNVVFKRPNPDAIICADGACSNRGAGFTLARITVQSSDGTSERIVTVRQNGQISVGN